MPRNFMVHGAKLERTGEGRVTKLEGCTQSSDESKDCVDVVESDDVTDDNMSCGQLTKKWKLAIGFNPVHPGSTDTKCEAGQACGGVKSEACGGVKITEYGGESIDSLNLKWQTYITRTENFRKVDEMVDAEGHMNKRTGRMETRNSDEIHFMESSKINYFEKFQRCCSSIRDLKQGSFASSVDGVIPATASCRKSSNCLLQKDDSIRLNTPASVSCHRNTMHQSANLMTGLGQQSTNTVESSWVSEDLHRRLWTTGEILPDPFIANRKILSKSDLLRTFEVHRKSASTSWIDGIGRCGSLTEDLPQIRSSLRDFGMFENLKRAATLKRIPTSDSSLWNEAREDYFSNSSKPSTGIGCMSETSTSPGTTEGHDFKNKRSREDIVSFETGRSASHVSKTSPRPSMSILATSGTERQDRQREASPNTTPTSPPRKDQLHAPFHALFRPYLDVTSTPSLSKPSKLPPNSHELQMSHRSSRDSSKPHQPKRYPCDLCGRAFSRTNTLVTHRRIHTGEKPFACNICGRAFRQPGNLTRHRLVHTSIKPYACLVCQRAFNRPSNLKSHMRTHTI